MTLKKEKLFLGMPKKYQILLFSGMGAIIAVFIGFAIGRPEFFGFFLGIGVMVGFIPYSIASYSEKKGVKDMEDNLPAFLRDIAEAKKTGMTLPQALYKSAEVDYGALTSEVKKMANQISWGVPFNEVLSRFSDRCKSEFMKRSIAIIIEAQISGGAITETLDAVARDARLIKESEKERKTRLNQQAMIMYAIFFLFLAIVVALQRLMIPLVSSRGFSLAAENPEEILSFYRMIFFSMIVIQGVFSGLLAGQIGEGSVTVGLKHSAIFLVMGVVVSWIMIF
jgi:flagellar protein FlaJ